MQGQELLTSSAARTLALHCNTEFHDLVHKRFTTERYISDSPLRSEALSEVSKNAAFLTVESCFTASRTGMLDDHLLSAVHQYIFSILAAAVTKRDVVPPIRDRTTRPTVVRRRSILGVKQRDVGVCLHDHGLPRDLVHNFTGFDYLRGHFFVSHRSVCSTGSAVLGFLTRTIKALRFFATSVAVQQSTQCYMPQDCGVQQRRWLDPISHPLIVF